jgi:hypothetical protein
MFKRSFDLAKDVERVWHHYDPKAGVLDYSCISDSRQRELIAGRLLPLTVVTTAGMLPIRYELTKDGALNVAERTFPITMMQRLVEAAVPKSGFLILSEHKVGQERFQYVRVGAKPLPARGTLPERPQSIHDLNPDGSLKAASYAQQFDNKPFA